MGSGQLVLRISEDKTNIEGKFTHVLFERVDAADFYLSLKYPSR